MWKLKYLAFTDDFSFIKEKFKQQYQLDVDMQVIFGNEIIITLPPGISIDVKSVRAILEIPVYWCGVDVGQDKDKTVITAFENNKEFSNLEKENKILKEKIKILEMEIHLLKEHCSQK